jgi:biopolymer transport protein ExbB
MKQFKVKSSTLKKGFFCLFVPAMFFCKHLTAQLSGYAYGKTITIQGSQISGTVTNFPVLISFTDNNLRTTGNGGHVQSANGYDIIFTLPDCSTILPMQIEKYTASTGEYVAWVQLPSLVSGNNQIIYMFYGKTGVAIDPSSTTVWDGNYMGVYHFNNSVTDGTSNTRNLTDNSTANLTTGSKIGDCRRLANGPTFVPSASGRYLQLPDNIFNSVTDFTFEGWVYLDDVATNWERIFDFGRNTNFNMFLCPSIGGNGIKRFAITTGGNVAEQQVSSTTSTSTLAWHHFAVTIDATANTGVLYYDGAVNRTNTGGITLDPSSLGTNNQNYFGRSQYAADEGLYGNFDEFRISSTTRSAGWIATSYNNQNSPATFYTVASEVTAGALCSALPVKLTSFEAIPAQNGTVTINWVAEQESTGDKYIVERSANGTTWEAFKTIAATGNSGSQKYSTQDPSPLYPATYYRIQQLAGNNTITYTQIVTAKLDASLMNSSFMASPNPAHQSINISFRENALPQNIQVELWSNTGMRVPVQPAFNGNSISMKLPMLANGVYFLNVYIKGYKHSRKMLIVQ